MIEVADLTKIFREKKRGSPVVTDVRAVDGISLEARPGEIFGLLGPNGAGKTTLLRMLSTLLTPTSGTARIQGHDLLAHPEQVRAAIGFVTGSTALYERLSGREVLHYFADLHGMSPAQREAAVDRMIEKFDLSEFIDRRCDRYSTGQRQRVNIARATLHDPPVLFFDEPASGLDVLAARSVVRYIRECRDAGSTVIFSTHVMSEVETLCDRIAIIYKGKIAATGTLSELRERTGVQPMEHVFLTCIGEEL